MGKGTKESTIAAAEATASKAEAEQEAACEAATEAAEAAGGLFASRLSESVIVDDAGQYFGLINRKPPHKSNGAAGKMLGGYVKARWIENGKEHVARGNVFVNNV